MSTIFIVNKGSISSSVEYNKYKEGTKIKITINVEKKQI